MNRIIRRILILIVILLVVIRIIYVNNTVANQVVNTINSGERFSYNGLELCIDSITLEKADENNDCWNIVKNRADNIYVVLAYFKLSNPTQEKQYFDFSSVCLSIDTWFSNMDIDIFKKINPIVKENIRVCLNPGSEASLVVPFCIYFSNDKNDPMSHLLYSNRELRLSVGIYPIKNQVTFSYDIGENK